MRGGKGGCRVLICKELTIPDAEAIKEGGSEKCGSKQTGCLQLRMDYIKFSIIPKIQEIKKKKRRRTPIQNPNPMIRREKFVLSIGIPIRQN
ncbi:hypothetical protein CEXT_635801 [Caerostris extrusa]|uniref:Uncharacterized protein n=1 Tax=Caerostris extrusa TaxID=172846 RepID=A0AAV4MGH5_CAEEX|nr:hypothetical protein CEXT_635801 [Caerostris extrusa]